MLEMKGRYLAELFRSPFAQEQFNEPQRGIKNSFRLTDVTQFIVPLPPLEEQHRIVAKVDELMTLCDRLETSRTAREAAGNRLTRASYTRLRAPDTDNATFRSNARFAIEALPALTAHSDQVVSLRQTILDLAVRGKLVEQDPADEPASELLKWITAEKARLVKAGKVRKKFATNSYMVQPSFDVPNTWCWVSLGTAFIYDAGAKCDPTTLEQDRWLVELEDIEKDSGRLISRIRCVERESKSTKSYFLAGDILYGKLRPYLNKVLVADEPGYSTTEIVAIRPYIPLCTDYCSLALRRPDFVEYVTRLGQGTKMPRLRSSDAVVAPFPLPPIAEQRRIVAKVDELMTLCDQLEASLGIIDASRHRLLESLFRDTLEAVAN